MCTLIVAWQAWPDVPLLVAANRDEHLQRLAAPPRRWDERSLGLLAPVDLQAGGTWWGVNGRGVFGAITNRAGITPDPSRRSRGELVVRGLEWGSAQEGLQSLAGLDADLYNPFHLVLMDREGAFLLWSDGRALHHRALDAGIHVFTERSLGAGDDRRELAVRELIERHWDDAAPTNTAIERVLATPGDLVSGGPCIAIPGAAYGTRSASVVRLPAVAAAAELLHAEGPPGRVPFADYSSDLRSLLADAAT